MAKTVYSSPLGTFVTPPLDNNPEAGPNFWHKGDMLADPRQPYTYQPGGPADAAIMGWPTVGAIPLIDQVPSTASATNIASAAAPTPGTPLVLVSASGAGVTVGCSITNGNTNNTVSGLLGLDVAAARTVTGTFTNGSPKITFTGVVMFGVQIGDRVTFTTSSTLPTPFALLTTYYVVAINGTAMMVSATLGGAPISATSAGSGTQTINVTAPGSYAQGPQPFTPAVIFGKGGSGTGGPVRYWNPAWAVSRCIVVTTNADDTGGFYTIKGYDYFGFPLTQQLTGVSSGTVTSTKGFKYIASVTPSDTINSTAVNVGTVDVFSLPLRTDMASYLNVFWGNTPPPLIAVGSLTFVAADISTATALTGDVRGTVYGGSASDGTKRLTVFWNPLAANMVAQESLLGQNQF